MPIFLSSILTRFLRNTFESPIVLGGLFWAEEGGKVLYYTLHKIMVNEINLFGRVKMKIISTSSWEKITKIAVKEEAKPSCCVRLKTYRGRKKEYKEESVRWSNHNKTEMAQNDLITFPRDLNLPCFSTLTTPKNVLLLPGASFILNKLLFFLKTSTQSQKKSYWSMIFAHEKDKSGEDFRFERQNQSV